MKAEPGPAGSNFMKYKDANMKRLKSESLLYCENLEFEKKKECLNKIKIAFNEGRFKIHRN